MLEQSPEFDAKEAYQNVVRVKGQRQLRAKGKGSPGDGVRRPGCEP